MFPKNKQNKLRQSKKNELFTHTEFSNAIDVGRIIATYSNQTVNEPFFLCKLLRKNTHMQMSTSLMIMIIIFLQAM